MVQVKVCGITNLEDARASVEAGADALGFNFWEGSKRYVRPGDARRIIAHLPEGVLCVGVFVNVTDAGTLKSVAAEAGVGAVQLHGDESPEYCAELRGLRVIKALRVGADYRPERASRYEAEAILLDAYAEGEPGGTGQTFDWARARETRERVRKLYLAGGLTPENVAAAIAEVEPFAVDVCSGVERAPGLKDARRVSDFVKAVKRRQT